ncbi:MAG: hypothetical protein FD123_589 [Bacteroidetes bacterium]|nr:MAG: hypothetical protein FD123_589 [Bacteroidota bacterium]
MKKLPVITVALVVATLATFSPRNAMAQKFQGQSVVTAGAGYSLAGILMGVVTDAVNATDASSTKTPVIAGMYDFGISDRFSVGAAYTYQGLTVKYSSYTDPNGNVITGNFTDRLTRQNFGVRALFHFGDNDDLDTYAGARFGYTMWNYSSSAPNGYDNSDILSGFGSPIKPQALFGMRYFFTDNIGANAEFAIGPTYFMLFGINARFGGN